MDLLQTLRKHDYSVLLHGIISMREDQDKFFQEILRKVQNKFQELQEADAQEINQNKVSRKKRVTRGSYHVVDKPTCNDSVCTTDLKEPLGSSTPTDGVTCSSSGKENRVDSPIAEPVAGSEFPNTPISEFKCPIPTESVKKRIEAFEKRTQTATLFANRTYYVPLKKNVVRSTTRNLLTKQTNEPPEKSKIYIEKVLKPRITRNTSKVLQDKNTNINPVREKSQDILHKKTVAKKASSTSENSKKKKELGPKASVYAGRGSKRETATKRETETGTHVMQAKKESELKIESLKKEQLSYIVSLDQKNKLVKPSKKEEGKSYNIDNVQDGTSTDDEDNPSQEIPSWAKKENRKHQLCAQAYLDKNKTIYQWFYSRRLKHPKIEELFSGGVKTRPRTSSAVWN